MAVATGISTMDFFAVPNNLIIIVLVGIISIARVGWRVLGANQEIET